MSEIFSVPLENSGGRVVTFTQASPKSQPVILTHGFFSSYKLCEKLALYLSNNGFACYIVEWPHRKLRYGTSTPEYSFKTLCSELVPEAISYVRSRHSAPPVWIGHSGGGLLPCLAIASNSINNSDLTSVVMLASQACHATSSPIKRALFLLIYGFTKLIALFPGKRFGLGSTNEGSRIMQEWVVWNLKSRIAFLGSNPKKVNLAKVKIPILSFAAQGDTLIAPPEACNRFLQLLGSEDKEYILCSINNGFTSDYSHSSIIYGEKAKREIWPKIVNWIKHKNANPHC